MSAPADHDDRNRSSVAQITLIMAELRRLLRRILPTALIEWLADFRSGDVRYRILFLRREFIRALRRDRPRDLSDVRTIVFVCYGNILRSPLAEELLRSRLEKTGIRDIQISSAGVNASTGKPADERGRISALDYGVSLESHRARLLTAEIVAAADVIVVMDRRNETAVIEGFPTAASKLVLLGSFLPPSASGSVFIADPYSGTIADVRRCYRTIATAVEGLVIRLSHNGSRRPQNDCLFLISDADPSHISNVGQTNS